MVRRHDEGINDLENENASLRSYTMMSQVSFKEVSHIFHKVFSSRLFSLLVSRYVSNEWIIIRDFGRKFCEKFSYT